MHNAVNSEQPLVSKGLMSQQNAHEAYVNIKSRQKCERKYLSHLPHIKDYLHMETSFNFIIVTDNYFPQIIILY